MKPLLSAYDAAGTTTVHVARLATPVGIMHVASYARGVCAVVFDDRVEALEPRLRRAFGPFFRVEPGDPLDVAPRFDGYFNGDDAALADVAIAAPATPMQQRVWDMVRGVPQGQVTTYAALAERMGMPRAQRAVGVCLASNPVPILVPCHRVIAASGGLGSHPGGIAVKAALLRHEGVMPVHDLALARELRKRINLRDRSGMTRGDGLDFVDLPLAIGS